MYEDLVFQSPELTIPHPLMHKRSFVAGPLAEIAATLMHPVLKKTIGEIYLSLSCQRPIQRGKEGEGDDDGDDR